MRSSNPAKPFRSSGCAKQAICPAAPSSESARDVAQRSGRAGRVDGVAIHLLGQEPELAERHDPSARSVLLDEVDHLSG